MPDTSAPEPVDTPTASRKHLIAARVLTVLAVVLTVVSILANFVKREALDPNRFRETSAAFIADPTIRDELAARLVDDLYANVDVPGALGERLPPALRPLAGPIAGGVRNAADEAARRLLEQPAVQKAFVNASAAAQRQFIAVLNDDAAHLTIEGNRVVLDLRPLLLQLGDRFGIAPNLDARVSADAGRLTILESNELSDAQQAVRALRFIANWIWVFALAAAVAAVWLARGHRHREVRALAIGLVIAGFLVLIARTLEGRSLVDDLSPTVSGRLATAAAYDILTDSLRGAGWTAIIIGIIALAGIWLSGPATWAVNTRRTIAPCMKRPEIAYGTLVVLYLLLLWWRPTPQFGFPRTILVWFVLAVVGFEVLRRQTAREFPDAEPTDVLAVVRGWFKRGPRTPSPAGNVADLERVAQLHSSGALDDEEFAAWKTRLLEPGSADRPTTDDTSPTEPIPPAKTSPGD